MQESKWKHRKEQLYTTMTSPAGSPPACTRGLVRSTLQKGTSARAQAYISLSWQYNIASRSQVITVRHGEASKTCQLKGWCEGRGARPQKLHQSAKLAGFLCRVTCSLHSTVHTYPGSRLCTRTDIHST